MKNVWPEVIEGRIATKNHTGFMFTDINGASPFFIEDSKKIQGTVADIGCAYGIVTLPVLQQSSCNVIAFDLSQEHLDILNSAVSRDEKKKLTLVKGRFPDDFNLAENSLDAIHCSYMLHFLTGKETEEGLKKWLKALKPGGKLYINTASAYFKVFQNTLAVYEERATKGAKFPGEFNDLKERVPKQDVQYTPEFIHVHKIENLESIFKQAGFNIDKCFYYDLKEPAWFASDDKGCIGIIASKPN